MSNIESKSRLKVAVLGIGLMGLPMAQRLCAAGHEVHVWNRTVERAQPLAELGASVHRDCISAVQDADYIITMLEHGGIVGHVLFELGAATRLKPGSLVIDMSSIKPAEARDHGARPWRAIGCSSG